MPRTPPGTPCPCGSALALDACCGPYLLGTAHAPTALALMRSRYTGYVRAAVDYLVDTHDPTTRGTLDRAALARFTRTALWLGLEIVAATLGGLRDTTGTVEFIARGATAGRPFAQRERSRFRRLDDRWYYLDGVTS